MTRGTGEPVAPARRVAKAASGARSRMGARPRGRQARRPGVSIGRRMAGRLPTWRRALAAVGAAAAAGALVALLNGPWLRVTDVAWAGDRYTDAADLDRLLRDETGRSVLAVDTGSLSARIERLPAVADAIVSARLPGTLQATVVEHEAAFVWQVGSIRFLGSGEGMLFASLPATEAAGAELTGAPVIHDERAVARLMRVGDGVPPRVLEAALRLAEIQPAVLGSRADGLAVHLDDEHGFSLVSADPPWRVALGVYGADPGETSAGAAARLESQVTAVRTLFASHREREIGWVDARNPGKVYFRAEG